MCLVRSTKHHDGEKDPVGYKIHKNPQKVDQCIVRDVPGEGDKSAIAGNDGVKKQYYQRVTIQ
jgi:hypothetical protein